jgi:hypothetical protein
MLFFSRTLFPPGKSVLPTFWAKITSPEKRAFLEGQ